VLIARVRRTLVERALIPRGTRVLCACSGGPDSAALLFALVRLGPTLGFEVLAASVDHGLRPGAQRDVEIAAAHAAQLAVPFHPLRVRVVPGASLQARAREARYGALRELAGALGATRIAVGHTRDDQAETVLSRLLRGSGIRGLGAIEPARADGVVRPLLDCERSDVHRLARAQFAALALDESNHDTRFERVRIRTQVVPTLRAEDSALVRHLAELADEARDCDQIIRELAAALLERAQVDPETLEISVLRPAAPLLRRAALRRWLSPVSGGHLGRAELTELDRTLRLGRGEVWISAAHCVRAERDDRLRLCARTGGNG
jgi:tRNA(Ile)-lysidine synthase